MGTNAGRPLIPVRLSPVRKSEEEEGREDQPANIAGVKGQYRETAGARQLSMADAADATHERE